MRIDSAVSRVSVLACLTVLSAAAQNVRGSAPHNSHNRITAIAVGERAGKVDVEVTFSLLVKPEVSTLEHPDRLVFDFPECELAHGSERLAVNRGAVVAVRAAQFSSTPLLARVVIDLRSAQDHEETYVGNKLVIRLGGTQSSLPSSGENKVTASRELSSGRMAAKSSDAALPRPSTEPKSARMRAATAQLNAYALLVRARDLTVSDLEPLQVKAKAGDPESETILGFAYHAGTLLRVDDAEALRLLRHAANRGFLAAEEAMGVFSQMGFGMAPDKAQAVSWYTKAARRGSLEAATNLGLMYSTGDGVVKDAAKAESWYRSAAEAGDATAQLNLAVLYHRGEGLPRDDPQARVWLTKAANQGLLPAMLELAAWDMQPEHGRRVDDAIRWYTMAARMGDALAQSALGDIYSDQELGRVDYNQAVEWYQKAADQGQRNGQFGLGNRYLLGQGVPQNLNEARRWLTPAADQDHPYAQLLLAKMLEAGEGGPADAAAAAKYYERAANYGISEAQYRLGLLLAADRSNALNIVSAYKWLFLAKDAVKESAAAEQKVRELLTPAQLAMAERDANEWRIAHEPPR